MSKIYFLITTFIINLSFYQNLYSSDQDYCVGYLEEVYWSLDPIEETEIREQIIEFFNDNFEGAKNLDYDLYYCLLYTSPSPRDRSSSRMPSSA